MQFLKRFSLMSKLITLSLSIVTILGLGSWISINQIAGAFNDKLIGNFEFLAGVLGENIANQFHSCYDDVQVFANSEAVRTLNSRGIAADLDVFVEKFSIYDLIVVVDKNGKLVASNSKDSSGKSVNFSELSKLNFAEADWFKNVLQGKTSDDTSKHIAGTFFEDMKEDLYLKSAFGETRIGNGFSAPIRNIRGELVGVISTRPSEKWLTSVVKEMLTSMIEKNYAEAEITVINKDGVILFESAFDAVDGVKDRQFKVNLVEEQNRAAISALQGNAGAEFVSDSRRKKDMIAGFQFLNGANWISDIGWSVIVKDSKADALIKVTKAMYSFYFILGFMVLATIAISLLFAVMLTKAFSAVTETLHLNSSEVDQAANNIAAHATQLSAAATEQASALQETVSVVHEINAMVEKNAESAGRSKVVSSQSRETAENGQRIVDHMIEAINDIDQANQEITNQLNQSNRELSDITRLINDIGTKTNVINEIVFQTKLLSFNASVEAARAGDYGKGFSVVAQEVGNLAQMSGFAAKEITTLLEESIRKVETIVSDSKSRVERLTSLSKDRVNTGSTIAKECNQALDEIIKNVHSVDLMVSEIAVASQEQSSGIREISKAVGQMETMTQQNSSVAQTSSVAAEQLKIQSHSLAQVVRELSAYVHGSTQKTEKALANVVPLNFKKNVNRATKSSNVPRKNSGSKTEGKIELKSELKRSSGSDLVPSADDDPRFKE